MDEINFDCDQLLYFTHFVLCDYAVSFSSISVNGREDETDVGFCFAGCLQAFYIKTLQALIPSYQLQSALSEIASLHQVTKSGYNDPSKSTCWKLF